MCRLDITLEDKTYHMEVPVTSVSRLQIIVDGLPFELSLSGVGGSATQKATLVQPVNKPDNVIVDAMMLPAKEFKVKWPGYARDGD
jgi:hypothetical protein